MFFLLPFEWCQRALSVFEVFCQPCDCRREYIDLSWFYASSFPFLPQKNCLNHSSLEVSSHTHRRHWPQCMMSCFSQFDNFSTYLLTSCVFHSTSTYFTEKKRCGQSLPKPNNTPSIFMSRIRIFWIFEIHSSHRSLTWCLVSLQLRDIIHLKTGAGNLFPSRKTGIRFSLLKSWCSESSRFIPSTVLWRIWFSCSFATSFTENSVRPIASHSKNRPSIFRW